MHATLQTLESRYPDLKPCIGDIENAFALIRDTFSSNRKLLICGNGGSASDSEHIVGELMKGFQLRRPVGDEIREKLTHDNAQSGTYLADHLQGALPAIALTTHAALITAICNDGAGDMIFAQQVYGYGNVGDVLLGISTSGNSRNVILAFHVARACGLSTIGLTGQTGGQMNALCDVTIRVPYQSVAEIQERHLPIYHALCIMLEQEFFNA